MAYCGPRGIPLSVFLGWDTADQDAALEWQAHEAARCGGCGTHREDWNPATGGSRTHGHWHQTICPGCQAKERAGKAIDRDAPAGTRLAFTYGSPGSCPACRPAPRQPTPPR